MGHWTLEDHILHQVGSHWEAVAGKCPGHFWIGKWGFSWGGWRLVLGCALAVGEVEVAVPLVRVDNMRAEWFEDGTAATSRSRWTAPHL